MSAKVLEVLENLRNNRSRRVRIFSGDLSTGKNWHDDLDCVGTIGRSTGREPVYLLVPNSRSTGGGPIMVDNVLGIFDTKTRQALYRHPKFSPPLAHIDHAGTGKYTWRVLLDGEECARFETEAKATRWAEFMIGNRMAP